MDSEQSQLAEDEEEAGSDQSALRNTTQKKIPAGSQLAEEGKEVGSELSPKADGAKKKKREGKNPYLLKNYSPDNTSHTGEF